MIGVHRFDATDRARLLDYFLSLRRSDDMVEPNVLNADGLTLMLPGFSSAEQTDDFLTWLQRGRLCNPFPPESTFRRLKVHLVEPIDRQDPVSIEFRR